MNRNTQSYIEYVKPESIFRNVELENLYKLPINYEFMKENVRVMGIITPLIVNSNNYEIISGNLRHRISTELCFPLIPVVFVDLSEDIKLISLSSNVQRENLQYRVS